jgi:hypothetical protein
VSLHDRKRFFNEQGEPLVNFQLFDKNGGKKTFSTPYYICDGGYVFGLAYYQYNLVLEILCFVFCSFIRYHKWQCLMDTTKHASSRKEFIFSGWLESLRKDVEVLA